MEQVSTQDNMINLTPYTGVDVPDVPVVRSEKETEVKSRERNRNIISVLYAEI